MYIDLIIGKLMFIFEVIYWGFIIVDIRENFLNGYFVDDGFLLMRNILEI